MSAFMIVHVTVKDQAKFQEYVAAAPATIAAFGGKFLMRGKVASVLEGEHGHQLAGVFTFPDQAAVTNWYNSPAYQALIPNRLEAADMVFIGLDEPPA